MMEFRSPEWFDMIHAKAHLDWDGKNEKQCFIVNSVLTVVEVIEQIGHSLPHLPVRMTKPNVTSILTIFDGNNKAVKTMVLHFNNVKRWRKLLSVVLADKGYSMFVDNTCSATLYILVERREIDCD